MKQDEFKDVKAREGMNHKDKYFFLALSFAQLGIVCVVVVFNSWFWHVQIKKNKELSELKQISTYLSERTDELDAEMKVDQLKRNYEGHGIGVEEVEE